MHRLALLLLFATPTIVAQEVAATATTVDVTVQLSNTPDRGPADMADDVYTPGGEVVYLVVVRNRGPAELRNAQFNLLLPAGIVDARWACTTDDGRACGAGEGALRETIHLPPAGSLSYRLSLQVPLSYPSLHPSLTQTATVTLPADVVDTTPQDLTAIDSDPASTHATVVAPSVVGVAPIVSGPGAARPGSLTRGPSLGGGLQAPFERCGPDMYITQGPGATANTTLSLVDTTTVPYTLTTVGTGSVPYNAVGFRPADRFLYGIRIGTSNLVRINADGSTEPMGAIQNLPTPPNNDSYNAGEIGTDGFMYVKLQADVSFIYRIDLSPLPAAAVATRINLLGGTISGADLAWINGRLYTVNQNGTVSYVNPTTGAVIQLPAVNGALGNVGALFGTPSALYGSRNNPGGFYEFDLDTGAATRLSGSPVVGTNDGAHCASAEIVFETDLGVTKTNTPAQGPSDLTDDTYLPGSDVAYTIAVTNRGPVGVQNARVVDELPAGITVATWTCAASLGAVCGAVSGTGPIDDLVDLEPGASATYLLTLTVPPDYPQTISPNLTNTVTVTLPANYSDPTPGDLTATDSDRPPVTDLQIVKQASRPSIVSGETISYTLTASNLGPSPANNSVITDVPDTRLDCGAPVPTASCVATGGAVCPAATVAIVDLLGAGITIPTLPVNGTVVITMVCTASF